MGGERSPAILANLTTLFGAGSVAGLSDGALLERVLEGPADRAESAFAALVERHGAMVLRVSRQVMDNPHDAEDVAQATFLVLARRARSIRRSDSVASWLYGVACRVAARARADALRQRTRERRGAEIAARRAALHESDPPSSWPALHEELGRLPEKFRLPIVLCHLEGLSHEQAAHQIGCPVRTIQSRLARGRARLKSRLIRRGVGPAAAVLASTPTSDALALGPGLTDAWKPSIVKAAARVAAGGSAGSLVSNPVAALVEGVLTAMRLDPLKSAAVWLGLTACALGILAHVALRAAERPADRYRATMSDGTTVELVGVSTHPSGPKTWWNGDGSPLDQAPVDPSPSQVAIPGHEVRAIVVRIANLPEGATLKWLPSYDGSYTGDPPTRGGKEAMGLDQHVAAFRKDRATCSIEVRVASGSWQTEAADTGEGGVSFVKNDHKFYFGKARKFEGGTAIAVAHNLVGRDNRCVAVDHQGKEHPPTSYTGGGEPILSLLDVEFPLPPERIREYQVQSRPFERAEIKEIALRPRTGSDAKPRASDPPRPTAAVGDGDGDGDGLSDDQEVHKYRTDPTKFSTAGDGVSDGDWSRRREFTYTIRSVVKVMPPVNLAALNDDYQDARVLARGDDFLRLEVIHYPLNTNAEAIRGNPDWKRTDPEMAPHLRPGVTTNWDAAMRRDLVEALGKAGIDPDALDDRDLVAQAARWLFANSKFLNMFCTHYVDFPGGRPEIHRGLEAKFAEDRGNPAWSTREQLEHELFGRSMFAHRTHGTCTSSATYLATVLRALGIPTRMVLAIPLVDPTDPSQSAMVRDNLRHHPTREAILNGLSGIRGYASHTFNEVFVGGRWVRLNYRTLGQNSLDAHTMGLLTHVNTFDDLSEAGLAATWGKRYALGERGGSFPHGNPYRTEELSDHFGKFARIDNPEVREHRAITLSRAYWAGAAEAPAMVKETLGDLPDGAGHLLVHGEEWFADQPYPQYKRFMQAAGKGFLLRAEGRPDVAGTITMNYFTHAAEGLREMEILIAPADYARMAREVDYVLTPLNETEGYAWRMKGRVTVRRP